MLPDDWPMYIQWAFPSGEKESKPYVVPVGSEKPASRRRSRSMDFDVALAFLVLYTRFIFELLMLSEPGFQAD
jgi:hypothetical protein